MTTFVVRARDRIGRSYRTQQSGQRDQKTSTRLTAGRPSSLLWQYRWISGALRICIMHMAAGVMGHVVIRTGGAVAGSKVGDAYCWGHVAFGHMVPAP